MTVIVAIQTSKILREIKVDTGTIRSQTGPAMDTLATAPDSMALQLSVVARLNRAFPVDSADPISYYNRANLKSHKGFYESALTDLENALAGLQDDKQLAWAFNLQAICLKHLGRNADALKSYKRALRIEPDEPAFLYNLANLQTGMGKHDEALKNLGQSLALNPKYGRGHNLLGKIWRAKGDNEKALGAFNIALSMDTTEADFYIDRYQASLALNRYDNLEADARRAVHLDSTSGLAHAVLAEFLDNTARRDEALDEYLAALRHARLLDKETLTLITQRVGALQASRE